jgi:ATP-dependent Lon protease
VDSKIAKRQREYYLIEQLKGIKKELGIESDGKGKLIEKFRERAASLNIPGGVRKVFEEELAKLQGLEPAASDKELFGFGLVYSSRCLHFESFIFYIYSLDSLGSSRA